MQRLSVNYCFSFSSAAVKNFHKMGNLKAIAIYLVSSSDFLKLRNPRSWALSCENLLAISTWQKVSC